MNPVIESYQSFWDNNRAVLNRYLIVLAILGAALAGYFLIEGEYRYVAVIVAPIVFLLALVHPRFAVYQFIVLLFSNAVFSESPVILYVDLSAFVLACAAFLDFLLKGSRPGRFPRLTLNWVLIIAVMFVSAAFGYNPVRVFNPLVRIVVMAVTFLSVYRLSGYFTTRALVSFFFWIGVANAVVALVPLAVSGEVERVFGFALKTLDDLMMICLPIGLLLYLWSPKGKGTWYLLGSAIAFVALLATQSRFPIIFSVSFSGLALLLSLRLARRRSEKETENGVVALSVVKRRVIAAFVLAGVAVVVVAGLKPELITAVVTRFEVLLTSDLGGTARLRLVLWQSALQAFWDHPLLGIGPANFDLIHRIYQQLHLDPAQMYIQGLSAHNLMIHYLAEIGIIGASIVAALFINQFRMAREYLKCQARNSRPEIALILFVLSLLFLVTAFVEAAWMWGQTSFVLVFFLALIVKSHEQSPRS